MGEHMQEHIMNMPHMIMENTNIATGDMHAQTAIKL